jgi:hypothetical protein
MGGVKLGTSRIIGATKDLGGHENSRIFFLFNLLFDVHSHL